MGMNFLECSIIFRQWRVRVHIKKITLTGSLGFSIRNHLNP